jgi:hypothetical protein
VPGRSHLRRTQPTLLTTGVCELVIGVVLNALGIWQIDRQHRDDEDVRTLYPPPM